MCYEGSLIAALCNSLFSMKNGLYSVVVKKKDTKNLAVIVIKYLYLYRQSHQRMPSDMSLKVDINQTTVSR
jgi:hypothetical protein